MISACDRFCLSRFSHEFVSPKTERAFLVTNWYYLKAGSRNAFAVGALMCLVFVFRDLALVQGPGKLLALFFLRLVCAMVLMGSAAFIHFKKIYFERYHLLLLFNQLVAASTIFLLASIKRLDFINHAINPIIFTLVFYQFVNNRFIFTLLSSAVLGLGFMAVGAVCLDVGASDMARYLLFLAMINTLGVFMLRSLNRTRRQEYMKHQNQRQASLLLGNEIRKRIQNEKEREALIDQLQTSLDQVKTLEGLVPICSHCKKIRTDGGYWQRVEEYFHARTNVQFSHSLCDDCARTLYPGLLANRDKKGVVP